MVDGTGDRGWGMGDGRTMANMTAEELLRLPDDGFRCELIRGELKRRPLFGGRHGHIAAQLIAALSSSRTAGDVYASAGFHISREPDTVLVADVAVLRKERFAASDGFVKGTPDVAFAVVDEGLDDEVEEKRRAWLDAGAPAVVIVDPRTKSVRVHRRDGATSAADVLAIDDVIPGWQMPLSDLFG